MRKNAIKLLSALENKNGNKWLHFYEDNTYSKPTYYATWYNGGQSFGQVPMKEAAAQVVAIGQKIGGLKLIPLDQAKP